MHPRVILIAEHYKSTARELVWNALDSSGCWIIEASQYKLWLLEEQLKIAHAVVVLVDKWVTTPDDHKEFRLLIETVQKHQAGRPELRAIALVDSGLDLRIQLKGFTTFNFVEAPSPADLQRVVELIHEDLPAPTPDTGPGLAELVEEARLQRERLALIAQRSTGWTWMGILAAATIILLGVVLSLPRLVSRWELSTAWLSIGPAFFFAGTLTAVYFIRRLRRESERKKIASFLAQRLEAVINETDLHRTSLPIKDTSA